MRLEVELGVSVAAGPMESAYLFISGPRRHSILMLAVLTGACWGREIVLTYKMRRPNENIHPQAWNRFMLV